MNVTKTAITVEVDELDVHGNGCLNDCTARIYPISYKGTYGYGLEFSWWCGVPNAYRSIFY